mmetsp:Transcript_30471/g.25733  ORF Transcript_30471/g.25733 Transcript_30471/m.25733 type:complete len:102 (+) Transcript_30471:350-655(+)
MIWCYLSYVLLILLRPWTLRRPRLVRVLKTSYRSMITNAAVVSFRCRFMTQHVESERYSETEEDRERDARTHTHTHIHVYGHTDAQKGARAHWHNVMCLDT